MSFYFNINYYNHLFYYKSVPIDLIPIPPIVFFFKFNFLRVLLYLKPYDIVIAPAAPIALSYSII